MKDSNPTGSGSVFYNRSREVWVAQVYAKGPRGTCRKTKSYATEEEARAGLADLRRAFDVRPGEARAPEPTPEHSSVFWDRTRERWVGQHRYLQDGKRKARTVVRLTEREARDALAELMAATAEQRPTIPTGGALLREWLAFYVREVLPTEGLSAVSNVGIEGYVDRELAPSPLARIPLDDLTALDVHRYLSGLAAAGRGPATVKQIRNALSKALKAAVLYGRLDPGVTAALQGQRLPRARRVEARGKRVKTLTHERARLLLSGAGQHEPLITVMLGTGLRRGEVLALRWSDIDWEAGTMHYHAGIEGDGHGREVYGLTKGGEECHDVLAPMVLDALRRQRTAQNAARLAYPWPWAEDEDHDDFVFTNARGRRLRRDYVTRLVSRLARAAGAGHVTPHMLRHSAASFLAAAGTPVPVIQRVLHHASEDITKDVYIHLLERAYGEGTEALDAVLHLLASGE